MYKLKNCGIHNFLFIAKINKFQKIIRIWIPIVFYLYYRAEDNFKMVLIKNKCINIKV